MQRTLTGDDVYGALLDDVLAGRPAFEIVERDDGFVSAHDAQYLLVPFRSWDDAVERRALRFVRGRVLDVGCGGGRVCLHLQSRGLTVVGIDSSPGAVACCRRRGVLDARLRSLEEVDGSLGCFDTIVFLGQNLRLLGPPSRARQLLARLERIATAKGRIVAEGYDPHTSDDRVHVRYRERNVRRGRMPGQVRVRVRHRDLRRGSSCSRSRRQSSRTSLRGQGGDSRERSATGRATWQSSTARSGREPR